VILVLLGTNPYNFDRLIGAIDSYAQSSGEIIEIQLGNSVSLPIHAGFFKFLPKKELEQKIKAARLVIVHGGYGSIYDCLKLKKTIIAVPRKKDLNEALDPGFGQTELVQYLESKNRILALYDVEKLTEKIEEADLFEPDFYFENNMSDVVSKIIQNELYSGKMKSKPEKTGYSIFRNIFPLIFKNRLTEMTFFVTDNCNFRCKHCFMLDQLNVKKTKFLSLEEVREMGKHIHSMQRVHIGGGEPLIRPDIPEIIVSIANDWNTETICLPTNGSFQQNAINTAVMFGNKSNKYLRFHFSLNMIGSDMDEFCGHKDVFNLWDKTVKSVKAATKNFNNISVTILTTFNDFNQNTIDKLKDYVINEIDPDDFSFALVRSHKNYSPILDIEKFESVNHQVHSESRAHSPFIRAYRELIRKKIANYYKTPNYYLPCQSGKLRVVMSPDGDVFPCENMGYPEGAEPDNWKMGNIRDFNYNIHALLKSSDAGIVRKRIKEIRCHCHHGVDMAVSYQSTWKFKAEVFLLGLKYYLAGK
jgi:radical SAM protein with 4Fe4S-binding SPASM domain